MKRMGRYSIGQRLGASFLALAIGLGLFAAAVIVFQGEGARAQAELNERILPRTEAANKLERSVVDVALAVRTYLIKPSRERADRVTAAIGEARGALEALRAFPKEPDGQRLFDEMQPAVERYLAEAGKALEVGPLGNIETMETALTSARALAIYGVHNYVDLQRDKRGRALEEISAAREHVAEGLALTFVLFAAALVATGVAVTLAIQRPARELTRIALRMQQGDWQPALHFSPTQVAARGESVSPRNELAQIALAFGSTAEALERREQRLVAEAQVARAASSSLDRARIAEASLRAIAEGCGALVGAVYWREGEDTLAPVASRALPDEARPVRIGEGIPGQAAREGRLVVIDDIPADTPMRVRLGIESLPPRAIAAVPVMLRGELLGVVVLGSLKPFAPHQLEFLDSAALQLAIGLHNVRSHEDVQRLLADLQQAHEQLQAQNEELQAQGEELQAQHEELQAQSEELQAQAEELHARNDELRARTRELADADERKNDFLGLLAHELRNPLAAIGNSLFILERSDPRNDAERQGLAVIERQMRYLTRLIDDLLDVTRIRRGKLALQREPIDFNEVVRDCVHDNRLAARNAGLELHCTLPEGVVAVDGDRTRLAQVLGNLINNAIKFTDAGGRVEVALEPDPGSGQAVLRVRDTGVGISPELAERLFQPFSQGDMDLARGKGGLGLGLALSRALVELHDGTIECRGGAQGGGAEFVVRLPLTGAQPRAHAEAPREGARQPRSILIVEDNEDAAETLRMALESEGHRVQVAGDGPEGVRKAGELQPDVVLCDIGIPGIDGFEVARRLRADARLDSTLLIALSGYATAEDRRRSADAGFDRHLAKPVEIESLLDVVSGRPEKKRAGALRP